MEREQRRREHLGHEVCRDVRLAHAPDEVGEDRIAVTVVEETECLRPSRYSREQLLIASPPHVSIRRGLARFVTDYARFTKNAPIAAARLAITVTAHISMN